jgi:hypothetical protein
MRVLATGTLLTGLALASTWGLGGFSPAVAQEQPKVLKTTRGGVVATTPQHQFEVFFYPTGVRVFPQTRAGQPVDVSQASATATFYHPNSPRPWFARPLRVSTGEPNSLELAIGLGNAPATGGKVTFEVTGLTDATEPKGRFTVPLEFVPQPTTQPTAPQEGVAAVPSYTYVPGYYGYGYYPYSSPAATSPPASDYHPYAAPSGRYRSGGNSSGPGRDWSTGRDVPLAKPWMRPMD